MPKFAIFSDLHLEFHRDRGAGLVQELARRCGEVDGALVAGDVSTAALLPHSLAMLCSVFPRVVYTPGNHEYYGSSPAELDRVRIHVEAHLPNLAWLDRGVCEVEGVKIVGATLWFPPSDAPKNGLNDFFQIRGFEPWVWQEHERDMQFLHSHLAQTSVLLTHHFPLRQSIPPAYANSALNPFFWAGPAAEDLALLRMPRLAVHGHTHDGMRYDVGSMHVECNPHGYPGERPDFDFGCTVEV